MQMISWLTFYISKPTLRQRNISLNSVTGASLYIFPATMQHQLISIGFKCVNKKAFKQVDPSDNLRMCDLLQLRGRLHGGALSAQRPGVVGPPAVRGGKAKERGHCCQHGGPRLTADCHRLSHLLLQVRRPFHTKRFGFKVQHLF